MAAFGYILLGTVCSLCFQSLDLLKQDHLQMRKTREQCAALDFMNLSTSYFFVFYTLTFHLWYSGLSTVFVS